MQKKILIANWKMNLRLHDAKKLVLEILHDLQHNNVPHVKKILCVPYVYIDAIKKITIKEQNVFIGAQNCNDNQKGPYTGEISADMLKSCGIEYVILGHSERRILYNETNKLIANKIVQSLNSNIYPIFCCGETLKERRNKTYLDYIEKQINKSLFHLTPNQFSKILIAYEPVWAIGTGQTAEIQEINEIHEFIREKIRDKFGKKISDSTPILYGGSVNPQNAYNIFSLPNVNGSLVGGASLNSKDFLTIIKCLN